MSSLSWGNITICQPSNGFDLYHVSDNQGPIIETDDITIDGASGRYLRPNGAKKSDDTSIQYTIEGFIFSTSASVLNDLKESIWNKQINTRQAVDYLSFSVPCRTGANVSLNNYKCDFKMSTLGLLEEPIQQILAGSYTYVMGFTAKFTEVY